jgi:hypothetical protein
MSRKEDVDDSNSAPAKMSSRLALGDDAESCPTDLTATATNTDDPDNAVQEALTSLQCPALV